MTNDLFRREVFEAKRSSWLGKISLVQPLNLWVIALLAFLTASAVVLFLVFGTYTRRSTVTGQLVPDSGLSTVIAPVNGVLSRLFEKEGNRVGKDAPLLLIQAQRTTATGEDSLTVVREGLIDRRSSIQNLARSQEEQLGAQIAGADQQLQNARRELAQIEDEIETRRDQVQLARETVERYERVAQEKYVSEVQVQQQRQSMLELLNAQQALERQATSIRRNIAQLSQSLRELPAQQRAVSANRQRDLAALDQERVQQEATGELMVKSPLKGLIASQLSEPGQAVQAGQPILSIIPEGAKLQAQLMVPSAAIGFIAVGDAVLLRYQAYPYQKFGHHQGRIVRISRNAISLQASDNTTTQPMYRVIVALDKQTVTAFGKEEALKPGMIVDADILGEKRKLYEWLFEPLYSLTGKISN